MAARGFSSFDQGPQNLHEPDHFQFELLISGIHEPVQSICSGIAMRVGMKRSIGHHPDLMQGTGATPGRKDFAGSLDPVFQIPIPDLILIP